MDISFTKKLEKRVAKLEKIVAKLEKIEKGLIPFSNDPSELEIAQQQSLAPLPNPRRLHTFISRNIYLDSEPDIRCSSCNVSLSDCGATKDSWYCA